jgi:hypothetical protein
MSLRKVGTTSQNTIFFKNKAGHTDIILNTVVQKLQSEGKYTAFGKFTATELASLGDEMAKYYK